MRHPREKCRLATNEGGYTYSYITPVAVNEFSGGREFYDGFGYTFPSPDGTGVNTGHLQVSLANPTNWTIPLSLDSSFTYIFSPSDSTIGTLFVETYVPTGNVYNPALLTEYTEINADFTSLTVSVSGVPESPTWAMMVIGFAGLGIVRYRRAGARYIKLLA